MDFKFEPSQLVPLLSGLIILMGVANSVFYYGSFGVNILHYMDFSELFISFLDAPIVLLVILIGVVFFFTINL